MHINDIPTLPNFLATISRFENMVTPEPMSGCHLWTGTENYGVLSVSGTPYFAHRLSWVIYNGAIPDGMNVLHRCDVSCCVNPQHLFLGTQLDNVRDMDAKGRRKSNPTRGERHPRHKLTKHDVLAIRSSDELASTLAARMGVSDTLIYGIRKRTHWPHV